MRCLAAALCSLVLFSGAHAHKHDPSELLHHTHHTQHTHHVAPPANNAPEHDDNAAPEPLPLRLGDFNFKVRVPPVSASWGTVKEFDAKLFAGRWYQVFENSGSINARKGKGGNAECAIADYQLVNDAGSMRVTHTVRYSDSKETASTKGVVYHEESDKAGALTVAMDTDGLFVGAHDVLALGPAYGGKYSWALVSEPLRNQLYMYVRDYENFLADDPQRFEMEDAMRSAGFILPWNTWSEMYHLGGCTYPDFPTPAPHWPINDKKDEKKDKDEKKTDKKMNVERKLRGA